MSTRDRPSLLRMFQARPARTALFTIGPLAIGFAQLVNASVHGTGIWLMAAVTVVMALFSVLVTRYHLTVFHRRRLYDGFE